LQYHIHTEAEKIHYHLQQQQTSIKESTQHPHSQNLTLPTLYFASAV